MTHIARWTATWLGFGSAPKKADAPAATPERMYSLTRMLQVHVPLPAGGEIKLFTQEMSTRCLLFKSATCLTAGEELTMLMLLRPDCPVRLRGTVRWTHEGARGHSGQIDFQPTPAQEAELLSYLELRSR